MLSRDTDNLTPTQTPGVPLGRYGQAGDVAAAVEFVLSADARHLTGTDLAIDGGYLAQGR